MGAADPAGAAPRFSAEALALASSPDQRPRSTSSHRWVAGLLPMPAARRRGAPADHRSRRFFSRFISLAPIMSAFLDEGAARPPSSDFVTAWHEEGDPDFVPRRSASHGSTTTAPSGPSAAVLSGRLALDRWAMAPTCGMEGPAPFASGLEGDLKGAAATGKKGLLALIATPLRHDDRGVRREPSPTGFRTHPIRGSDAGTPMWCFSPCSNCSPIFARMASRPSSSPAAASSSCASLGESVYGIPPEQVVGSSGKLKFDLRDGKAVLVKLPEDLLGRRQGGQTRRHPAVIGRRPIAAFGDSDGDLQMLGGPPPGSGRASVSSPPHRRRRESAYDRQSTSELDKACDEAESERLDRRRT